MVKSCFDSQTNRIPGHGISFLDMDFSFSLVSCSPSLSKLVLVLHRVLLPQWLFYLKKKKGYFIFCLHIFVNLMCSVPVEARRGESDPLMID